MAARDGAGTRDAAVQFGQVLSQAKLVRVASKLSTEDLAEARKHYPAEDFSSRGIGEQMVAADIVEDVYGSAREACPEGWAVIQAAVDWRRIGVSRPVSRPVLYALFPRYLADVAPHLEPTRSGSPPAWTGRASPWSARSRCSPRSSRAATRPLTAPSTTFWRAPTDRGRSSRVPSLSAPGTSQSISLTPTSCW